MSKTKKKIEIFDFYDVNGMQKRLEAMAQQGWFVEKIDNDIWTYKKEMPADIHYAVTHFTNYSNSEAEPERGQAEFLEMCQAEGWQYVTNYNSLFVFINHSRTPVPLETDAVTQVENINNAMESDSKIYSGLILLIFPLIRRISDFISNPSKFVDSAGHLFMFIVLFAYAVMFVIDRLNYKLWHKKASKAAGETGNLLPVIKNRQTIVMFAEAILLLFIAEFTGKSYDPLFLGGIFVSLSLASGIYFYGIKFSKIFRLLAGFAVIAVFSVITYNSVIAAGFTPVEMKYTGYETMPISMEKLDIQPTKDEYICEHTEFSCFLYERYQGSQEYFREEAGWNVPEFEYTLIKIKSDSFYKNLKKDYTHSMGNSSTTGAELWQANSVRHNTHMMQNGIYKYNVYYDDAILILRTPVILTDGQIEFVVDNLVKAYGVEVTL